MDRTMLQDQQILFALRAAPLDRIRLMKTLFLAWQRAGRPVQGPFQFKAYLYGPCAFDLYSALDRLERSGQIAQAGQGPNRWGRYFLTEAGQRSANAMSAAASAEAQRIGQIAKWAESQGFRALLDSVYGEAPDYATNSVVRQVPQQA